MGHTTVLTGIVAAVLLTIGLVGCSSKAPESNSVPSAGHSAETDTEHASHAEGTHENHGDASQSAMEKMKAELAKLSPEDAASAEKQHACPVSGEMLGGMGAPMKVDVNGQPIWICCEGCKNKLLANPDKYLAKVKQE